MTIERRFTAEAPADKAGPSFWSSIYYKEKSESDYTWRNQSSKPDITVVAALIRGLIFIRTSTSIASAAARTALGFFEFTIK
jgi:hypothetical protein